MKKFDRYTYYNYVNKDGKQVVVAVSRHAGQTVKGYAVCDPADEFDLEVGKKLAAARCNQKVLAKKINSNAEKVSNIDMMIMDLMNYRESINARISGDSFALSQATAEINDILASLG